MRFIDDAIAALKVDIKSVRAKLQQTPMMARHGQKYMDLENRFSDLGKLKNTADELHKLGDYMKGKGIPS